MRFPRSQTTIFAAISLICVLFCLPAVASDQDPAISQANQVIIPGPLRSFLRMAGISQKTSPEDVLPALARDVYILGYQHKGVTEYLVLLERYVHQARELQALTAPNGEIRVEHCENVGPLLQVLGYRLRNACGQKDISLVTDNPESAFLTIDSGFPLTRLEEALQTNTPFIYSFPLTRVPVLFRPSDWTSISTWRKLGNPDLLDVLMHDPQVARLYWAFSRIDPETRLALQRSPGLWNLLPSAGVLDFYGTQICVRSRKVLVPGGASAEAGWRDLVGASPESPGDFVTHLLTQDRGWLATYFDTLARVDQTQQAHFTQEPRLKRLYEAFREPDPDALAARASFRKAPELLVLFTRQQWMPNGEPRIPGNLDLWKQVMGQKTDFKTVREYGKRAQHWNHPEQLLEAMTAFSRLETDSSPLQIYFTLGEVDSERSAQKKLSPETMLLMARNYEQFNSWYPIFSEFPELNDASVTRFINVAEALDRISNQEFRGNALGTFQANLGLWQILARQGEIPRDQLDSSWQKVIDPFDKTASPAQLFDAGYKSLGELMLAATGKANRSQDEIIDLLAGPPQKNQQGEHIRSEVADRMRLVLDDQRLTSLDTLFELNDGLNAMAHGAPPSKRVLALASELREFEMPRPIFTESEKDQWAPGVYSARHSEVQVRTDLSKLIQQSNSPAKLDAARGQLAPFLRDTLVGLNYAYYEPPGSQILHINPLFVRSHDFSGQTIVGEKQVWRASTLFGVGAPAGGGAYLVGSLADLPYSLAAAEQDFIAPENVQALIWPEIVPDLLASATLSRWWSVTPREQHAVALYQRSGEELLAASQSNPQLREKVVSILSNRMSPQRLEQMEQALQSKDLTAEIAQLLPADSFYLAAEFRQRFPQESASLGPAGQALDKLSHQYPEEVSLERLSKDFGIPHPELAQTYSRELLNVRPFPAFSGYSSRLFGESWDSSNLYWARLADERSDSPVTLNVMSPQLTRLMVSKIFANDYEDWPAVVRAMHEAGNDFLQGRITLPPETKTTAQR
ncbi:MAG TPA: hypothetical protein VHT28_09195 [Silvibacterium sp.]|nr:hypothetical protein [Silvibacterium sp.]